MTMLGTQFLPKWRLNARLMLCGVMALASLSLSACGDVTDRPVLQADFDYHLRHPIVLGNAPVTLNIIPRAAVLSQSDKSALAAFLKRFKAEGRSPISIESPEGYAGTGARAIRSELMRLGLPKLAILERSYPTAPDTPINPLRVSFLVLSAGVPSLCDAGTEDYGHLTDFDRGFNNVEPANFGCAYQTAFAGQIANPMDLVQPENETPPDIEHRMRAIEQWRKGTDPSTQWKSSAPSTGN